MSAAEDSDDGDFDFMPSSFFDDLGDDADGITQPTTKLQFNCDVSEAKVNKIPKTSDQDRKLAKEQSESDDKVCSNGDVENHVSKAGSALAIQNNHVPCEKLPSPTNENAKQNVTFNNNFGDEKRKFSMKFAPERAKSIIKELPTSKGTSKSTSLQKRFRAAFAKAKERGDPWQSFHIDELPVQLAKRYRYNPKKQQWVEDQVLLKMEEDPFAHGAMRSCYRVKKLSTILSQDWKTAANYVAKKYLEKVNDNVYFEDVRLQMDAKVWAEMYNRMSPPKQIDIFQMYVFQLEQTGQLYHLEHFIEGEYIKYNSNSGFVDEHMRHTPHAFSHFTFEHSGHKLIVVDVQGVGDLYTDPQIHTSEGTDYGDGNLGTKGMALFFHSHVCNPICKLLNLSKFDLSERELQELANNSAKSLSPATTVINPNRRTRNSGSYCSLSPHSEHAERMFSFESSPSSGQETSPPIIESLPMFQHHKVSAAVDIPARQRYDDSESFDFGSPLDEHFSKIRNHRPSTVVSADIEEIPKESVLGKIHVELAKYHELGRFHNEGKIDSESALFHLDIAAKLNNEEALKCLADIYLQKDNDILPSVTVPETDENVNKGIEYMMKSAELGDRSAQVFMAKAFETGYGLGSNHKKNWKMSVLYYEMAISAINDDYTKSYDSCSEEPVYQLMASLANLFSKGGFELEKDLSQAGDLYSEAAEIAMAQFKGASASKYFELAELAWSEMEE